MVNGVFTSCYADFDHDLVHFVMTPMQRFSEMLEWIFGSDVGFPVYVNIAREMGILMLPNGIFFGYSFE